MRLSDERPLEEQDWHRFRQLRQLDDHWQQPGWIGPRRSYHSLLTFDHPSSLWTLATQCQKQFRQLHQFDLVPLEGLHLTLQRLAFTDEISRDSLSATLTAIRRHCQHIAPFLLRIGWLAGSSGAIRFTTLPAAPIATIRDMIISQTVNFDAPANTHPSRSKKFWPHVSIAYSNTTQAAAPVVARVAALRHLQPAEALITSLALVELRREDRAYRWEVLERIELCG
jgi:2'-5' RNA ligase